MTKENETEAITMRIWLDSQMLFELQPKLAGKELKLIKAAIETLEEICLKK